MDEENLVKTIGADGTPLFEPLRQAVLDGTVSVVNALGNGIGDDKAVYAYLPSMIEYYLGERPLLENVPTYHCHDDDQRAEVLRRLGDLVLKPVDGYGGSGIVIVRTPPPRSWPRWPGGSRAHRTAGWPRR